MELAEIRPFEPQMAEIDLFTMPDAVGVGEPSVRKVKPYIAGHVTDGSSTFTFTVNGNDVTVSVSGGDWKYKPTAAITSLSFVGVPQLESLELNKITGVSTFNLDYPVVPMFKNCDSTTQNALKYWYHIRGTATESHTTYSLKYIDDVTDEITTIAEKIQIDKDGNFDIRYSGKKIYSTENMFYTTSRVITVEFTEPFDRCVSFNGGVTSQGFFQGSQSLLRATFPNAICNKVVEVWMMYNNCRNVTQISMPKATFEEVVGDLHTNLTFFNNCSALVTIDLSSATFDKLVNTNRFFDGCEALENLSIKGLPVSLSLADSSKLTEQSVVNLFNAVAADGITLTFHATVFAMIEAQLEIEDSPIYNAYWNSEYDFEYTSA